MVSMRLIEMKWRYGDKVMVLKGEDGSRHVVEIPNNYEEWHCNNMVKDYNNGKRSLI